MNETHSIQLLNLSTLLFFGSIIPLLAFIAYVLLNSPVSSPILKIMANRAYNKKKYRKAAKLYTKLDFFQAQFEGDLYLKKAALSYELAGSIQEALKAYQKSEEWLKVGQLLTELGKNEQAKEVYQEHELYHRLVMIYEQEKQFLNAGQLYFEKLQSNHKAEQAYRKAIDSDNPEIFIQAHLQLVFVYIKMNRFEEAHSQFEKANTVLQSSVQYEDFPELLLLLKRAKFNLQNIPES